MSEPTTKSTGAPSDRGSLPHLDDIVLEQLTPGQRLADRVAAIGGSWSFIIGFTAFLFGWTALNTVVLAGHAFDPFPFIFLNLMLSMVAALQAPVIMMSQSRQSGKDRLAAQLDYEINLRAERQISELHDELRLLRRVIERLSGPETQSDTPMAGLGSSHAS